ncbi:MAG: MotA/TolQ/ExbB proton channel family protein [Cocleimonas sp.]
MGDFINAMGIMSIPLILSSIVAIVVILSLFLTLKKSKVIPEGIAATAQKLAKSGKVTRGHVEKIREGSLLGRVLATGLESLGQPRHVMKENIEESGRHAIHSMDKYMTTLGTIAAIAPLLGLLGTVVGMIEVFSVITAQGVGSPTELAGGISKALLTTAAGIIIAVPALIFHRYFRSKINDYAIEMEKEAIKLISASQGIKPKAAPARRPVPQNSQAKRAPQQQGRVA